MNDQEIFDKVAAHLIKQGGPALNADHECMYRAPNGYMCAIGCLIPDSDYDPVIEGRPATAPVVLTILLKSHPDADEHLLTALQHIHDVEPTDDSDHWSDPVHLRSRLVSLAHNLNLSTDSLP